VPATHPSTRNNFWLFPIVVANPATLITLLRRHGFDVTQGASQLNYVPVPPQLSDEQERVKSLDPHYARRLWLNLLYLPVYPEMSEVEVQRLGALVKRHAVSVTAQSGVFRERSELWNDLRERKFDVLVVGGGINGCAVARDAAMRGLSVALVEKEDFASGSSGNSAKLVHGGFRYVERLMVTLVSELCCERDLLHRLNPNLVGRIAFLLPQYREYGNRMFKMDAGLWIYDACALLGSPLHTRHTVSQAVAQEPLLQPAGMLGSFKYYDCWTNDARLTLSNARQAAANGATVLNYCSFVEPSFSSFASVTNRVIGGKVRDELSGETISVSARHIVYAAGVEVDGLTWASGANGERARVIDATKGTHIVVLASRLPVTYCVGYQSPTDKRWCFCVPFFNMVVIGTTDTPHDVSQGGAKVNATRSEVEYLLAATNHVFPGAKLIGADVLCTWAGLRPLLYEESSNKSNKRTTLGKLRDLIYATIGGASAGSARSREDKLFQDSRGITVIGGGKLTPYRMVAERTVDLIALALGSSSVEPCITRSVPLDSRLAYVEAGTHVWWMYGSHGLWLEERVLTHPDEARVIVEGLPFRYCEVSLAVLLEQALMLEDVMIRRLALFIRAPDQGLACAPQVAAHMALLLGRSKAWVDEQAARYRTVVQGSRDWAQEPAPTATLVNVVN
jgi:glycerol-3-phosphate dehydrogenase